MVVILNQDAVNEGTALIHKTQKQVEQRIAGLVAEAGCATPGELRDQVFDGGELCCSSCIDYNHPHAQTWVELTSWLYLADIDWRTVG